MDGTLIDSNDAHARAWEQALAEEGHTIALERIRPLIGMGGDNLLPELGIDKDSPAGKAVSERRGDIFKERFLPGLEPFPGARALLERMKEGGLRLVVASSAQEDELRPMLERVGADELIEEATSKDDAEQSKPDPDTVEAALRSLGLPAGVVVMLGDTPYDLEAAARAGVGVIAFRCGGWDDEGLAGALAIYDDPADLLEHYDLSPLAGDPRP
jgi:phosphoglycolate phosphatase-like HAD superfamily hydrolase